MSVIGEDILLFAMKIMVDPFLSGDSKYVHPSTSIGNNFEYDSMNLVRLKRFCTVDDLSLCFLIVQFSILNSSKFFVVNLYSVVFRWVGFQLNWRNLNFIYIFLVVLQQDRLFGILFSEGILMQYLFIVLSIVIRLVLILDI